MVWFFPDFQEFPVPLAVVLQYFGVSSPPSLNTTFNLAVITIFSMISGSILTYISSSRLSQNSTFKSLVLRAIRPQLRSLYQAKKSTEVPYLSVLQSGVMSVREKSAILSLHDEYTFFMRNSKFSLLLSIAILGFALIISIFAGFIIQLDAQSMKSVVETRAVISRLQQEREAELKTYARGADIRQYLLRIIDDLQSFARATKVVVEKAAPIAENMQDNQEVLLRLSTVSSGIKDILDWVADARKKNDDITNSLERFAGITVLYGKKLESAIDLETNIIKKQSDKDVENYDQLSRAIYTTVFRFVVLSLSIYFSVLMLNNYKRSTKVASALRDRKSVV
jgi:hypothetical protein